MSEIKATSTIPIINSEFTFTCSFCSKARRIKYDKPIKVLNIRCSCGKKTKVQLCTRSYFRKKTDITATVSIMNESITCTIIDMSVRGYGIKIPDKLISALSLKIDDIVIIKYILPNNNNTYIEEQVRIKMITSNKIGVTLATDNSYNPEQKQKGFWLMT